MSCTVRNISIYSLVNFISLRAITFSATEMALSKSYGFIPCAPPQENEGMKFWDVKGTAPAIHQGIPETTVIRSGLSLWW